jgi:hypothetical protein
MGMVNAAKDIKLTATIKLICKIRRRAETGVRTGIKINRKEQAFYSLLFAVKKSFGE